ncbi:hypothetical protein [uncultured Hoeflea sp.]|uniref:hypothetical protein n=1 Tax=uncultured Hoeflea sp. TaxID=538666 RepID=UPI0026058F6F|nr:hypothetical protein [uncultured Hoeflea sp.]
MKLVHDGFERRHDVAHRRAFRWGHNVGELGDPFKPGFAPANTEDKRPGEFPFAIPTKISILEKQECDHAGFAGQNAHLPVR